MAIRAYAASRRVPRGTVMAAVTAVARLPTRARPSCVTGRTPR